jgi:hypothetical protein
MSLALLAVTVLVVLALGYRLDSGFVARQYALDDSTTTPAERLNDGVDAVPLVVGGDGPRREPPHDGLEGAARTTRCSRATLQRHTSS